PRGCATLRMGIAGITLREGVNITVNGRPAGGTGPMADTATIRRDGIRGYWSERNVAFDASLLRRGTNIIGLIVPPGGPTTGVMYDYLRLELDESGTVSDLAGNVGQALYETVTHETQPLESH
ncbi:MAG TPA: polysaccharide lyase family protein, partial [Verrucomicrobiota bacterium]|nr:polysaccharide lyase family protein [Verrucomicrobiota bacterium]